MLSNVIVSLFRKWIGPATNLLKTLWSLGSDIVLWDIRFKWGQRLQFALTGVGSSIIMPLSISISEALELVLSNIVIGVLSKWISPSMHLHEALDFLCSNVMLWLVWLVWGKVVLGARSSVSGGIKVPLIVSVGDALELLGSNIVVRVLSEWISIIFLLSE